MRLKHRFYTASLRLRSLFRRAEVEQELDEKLRYHIERQTEENIAICAPLELTQWLLCDMTNFRGSGVTPDSWAPFKPISLRWPEREIGGSGAILIRLRLWIEAAFPLFYDRVVLPFA